MKKLIGILAVCIAMCLCMTAVSFAATADIVHQSVEGTAVIDGTKDDAYANALNSSLHSEGRIQRRRRGLRRSPGHRIHH